MEQRYEEAIQAARRPAAPVFGECAAADAGTNTGDPAGSRAAGPAVYGGGLVFSQRCPAAVPADGGRHPHRLAGGYPKRVSEDLRRFGVRLPPGNPKRVCYHPGRAPGGDLRDGGCPGWEGFQCTGYFFGKYPCGEGKTGCFVPAV